LARHHRRAVGGRAERHHRRDQRHLRRHDGLGLPAASLATVEETRAISFGLSGGASMYSLSGLVVAYDPA
jgi:hypothetical protein